MWALALVQGFENLASGIGGVTVGAWLALLCDRRFTATQFALLSSAAAILGRASSSGTAGALIESLGYIDFYWLTTVLALPGVHLHLYGKTQPRRGRKMGHLTCTAATLGQARDVARQAAQCLGLAPW